MGPGKVSSSRSEARPALLGSLLHHPPPHYLSPAQDMSTWPWGPRGSRLLRQGSHSQSRHSLGEGEEGSPGRLHDGGEGDKTNLTGAP